jgi:hypothetical protein
MSAYHTSLCMDNAIALPINRLCKDTNTYPTCSLKATFFLIEEGNQQTEQHSYP